MLIEILTFCQYIADFVAPFTALLAFFARCVAFEAVVTTLKVKHATLYDREIRESVK